MTPDDDVTPHEPGREEAPSDDPALDGPAPFGARSDAVALDEPVLGEPAPVRWASDGEPATNPTLVPVGEVPA